MVTQLFLTVMAAIGALLSVSEGCSTSQIEECNKLIKTGKTPPGRAFQSVGEPQFSQMCREVDKFKTCVDRFYNSCDRTAQLTIDSIMKGIHYMCNDGKEQYLKHNECFGDDSLNDEAMKCVNKLASEAKSITARFQYQTYVSESDKNSALDDLCRDTDDFKTCVHSTVTSHCGEEAADFQEQVISRAYNPAESLGGCSPTSFRHMKWIILTCVSAAFLIVIIVCVVVRNHLRTRQRAGVENSFNNPLQGAYNPPKYEV